MVASVTAIRPAPAKSGDDGILVVKDVTKHFRTPDGVVTAVDNVSLSVKQGEFLAIIGPSGCGKSTLFNVVGGLLGDYDGEVTVAGEPVKLTQLEMKLLRYFVDREGRVIPREELLEKVWDLPGHLYTRAPDQFIRRLRKIFEPDAAQPRHFLTIREAGYRFIRGAELSS